MKIAGTGSALPKKIVTNDMLSEFLDTSDEWIRARTGVVSRHVISDERLEDLAIEAAKKALENASMDASELDFIICSNVVNEYVTPQLSCIIQGGIGASCPCIDINCACAGFIYAVEMAESFYKAGKVKNVLVVSAEAYMRSLRRWRRSCSADSRRQYQERKAIGGKRHRQAVAVQTSSSDPLYYKGRGGYAPSDERPGGVQVCGKSCGKGYLHGIERTAGQGR